MPFDRSRIVPLTVAVACLAGMGMAALLRQPQVRTADPEPWIPLPDTPMDAADAGTRETLRQMHELDELTDGPGTLAGRCGIDEWEPAERYALTIGDWVLQPDAREWHVSLVPDGQHVIATVREADWYTKPPPILPGATAPRRRHRLAPPTVALLPRARLEDVRRAWRRLAIWHAPPTLGRCLDGRPLMLEACVNGRYAARIGACGGSSADPLWAAVQAAVPAPRPAFLQAE